MNNQLYRSELTRRRVELESELLNIKLKIKEIDKLEND